MYLEKEKRGEVFILIIVSVRDTGLDVLVGVLIHVICRVTCEGPTLYSLGGECRGCSNRSQGPGPRGAYGPGQEVQTLTDHISRDR